jgi:hypothetical protein
MKFKKIATGTAKAFKISTKALKVATPLIKHQKELKTVAKYALKYGAPAAKYAYEHREQIKKGYDYAKKYAGKGNISVPGALVDASLGIAKRQGERYLDKKLGKYKAYQIVKAGVNTVYDVATGNPVGALNNATNLYSEIDPNKKRAAKIAGSIHGATGIVGGVMSGDVGQVVQGGLKVYSVVDPNKKRVDRVNRVNSDYVLPSMQLQKQGSKLNTQVNKLS